MEQMILETGGSIPSASVHLEPVRLATDNDILGADQS